MSESLREGVSSEALGKICSGAKLPSNSLLAVTTAAFVACVAWGGKWGEEAETKKLAGPLSTRSKPPGVVALATVVQGQVAPVLKAVAKWLTAAMAKGVSNVEQTSQNAGEWYACCGSVVVRVLWKCWMLSGAGAGWADLKGFDSSRLETRIHVCRKLVRFGIRFVLPPCAV